MPATPLGTEAHPCPADEQIFLAHAHEAGEMERYRGLALSFLPTHPPVSRLMAALGIECEHRVSALEALAEHLQLHQFLPTTPSRHPTRPGTRQLHLFITDDTMACQVLDHALTLAHHSRRFSELTARYCQRPELDALLAQFIEHKRNECRLLEESQDNAYGVSARA